MTQFWDIRTQDPLLEELAKYTKSGDALDIGAGQGRDALYLAQQGFKVTATEIDAPSLAILKQKTMGAELTTVKTDILTYKPNHQFDAIICDMVLHFLTPSGVTKAIHNLQSWTKPGGYNAVMAYTTKNAPGKRPYLFKPNELAEHYLGWELIVYKEEPTLWFQHEGEPAPRRNHAVYLLARKP